MAVGLADAFPKHVQINEAREHPVRQAVTLLPIIRKWGWDI